VVNFSALNFRSTGLPLSDMFLTCEKDNESTLRAGIMSALVDAVFPVLDT